MGEDGPAILDPGEIIERISQGLLVTTAHDVVLWNERFRELFTLPHDFLRPGLPLADLTSFLRDRGDLSLAEQDPTLDGKVTEFGIHEVFVLPLADGRFLDVRREPVSGGNIVSTYTDITDRRRAEAALRESEARYRQLVDGSVQGMLIVQGVRPVFVNERFTQLLGYSMDEVLGMASALQLVPEHNRDETKNRLAQRLSGEKLAPDGERELLRKDGSSFWAETRNEIVDWGGTPAVQTTIVDITEKREIAEIKDRFLAAVSHELRTPLTALDASLGYIADTSDALEAHQRELLQVGLGSVKRMERLVDSLLRVSALNEQGGGLELAPISLHEIVEGLVAANRQAFQDAEVGLTLEDRCPDAIVYADDSALTQVLGHLLDNACDFAPRGTTVRIAVEDKGKDVRVLVSDDGIGVPQDAGDQVFQRFWQGSPEGRRTHDGVGMGLALAKEVIEMLGGTVGYDRDRSKGAVFFADLPKSSA